MERSIGFLTADISRLLRKRLDAHARDFGGTGPQWRVLMAIERCPGLNQGMLAERLDVEPITTCRMVDRLEQAGLIERRRDPNDRRAWQLFLTEAAAPFIHSMKEFGATAFKNAFEGIDPADQNKALEVLERVRNNLSGDCTPETGSMINGRS